MTLAMEMVLARPLDHAGATLDLAETDVMCVPQDTTAPHVELVSFFFSFFFFLFSLCIFFSPL